MYDPNIIKKQIEQATSRSFYEKDFINIKKELQYDLGKSFIIGTSVATFFRYGIKLVSRPTKLKTFAAGIMFGGFNWLYYADKKLDQFLREEFAKTKVGI